MNDGTNRRERITGRELEDFCKHYGEKDITPRHRPVLSPVGVFLM